MRAALAALLLAAPASAGRLEARLASGGVRSENPSEATDLVRSIAEDLGGAEAARTGDASRNEAAMAVVVIPADAWGRLAARIKEIDPGAELVAAPGPGAGGSGALVAEREKLIRAADDLGAMAAELPMAAAAVQQDLDANSELLKRLAERRWLAFTARFGMKNQNARSMMSDAARLPPSADIVRAAIKLLEDRSPADSGWSDHLIGEQARKDAARRPKGAAAALRRELAENKAFFAERPELRERALAAVKRWDAPASKRR